MNYKSPLRKLVVFFKKSRDNWKYKYKASQQQVKSLKNKLNYQKKKAVKQTEQIEYLKKENLALKKTRNTQITGKPIKK